MVDAPIFSTKMVDAPIFSSTKMVDAPISAQKMVDAPNFCFEFPAAHLKVHARVNAALLFSGRGRRWGLVSWVWPG